MSELKLCAIWAENNLGYIGLNGDLPWGRKCKDDLKHFKALTLNKRLLVGYNTSLNLPPLPNREVVVDTREMADLTNIDFIIGGKRTYEKYAHLITELHISYIDDNTLGDTFAPDMSNLNPKCKIFNYEFKTI